LTTGSSSVFGPVEEEEEGGGFDEGWLAEAKRRSREEGIEAGMRCSRARLY
jgi:hypothetical protein